MNTRLVMVSTGKPGRMKVAFVRGEVSTDPKSGREKTRVSMNVINQMNRDCHRGETITIG